MELYPEKDFEIVTQAEDSNSLSNQIVAISKSLANTQIQRTLEQRKLFYMCLTKIDWRKDGNNP